MSLWWPLQELLLMHWSYVFFALTHGKDSMSFQNSTYSMAVWPGQLKLPVGLVDFAISAVGSGLNSRNPMVEIITVMSWCLTSQAYQLFVQWLVSLTIKNTSKLCIFGPLWGESTDDPLLSALLQLHLHSRLNTWLQLIGQMQLQDETRNI